MIIHIDLTDGKISMTAHDEISGGRVLSSRLISRSVDARVSPLAPAAPFVVAPSALAGTAAPNVNRLSVGAKSPLTGGIKEANVGGRFADVLARCDCQALVVRGSAPELSLLRISGDRCWLEGASEFSHMANYALYKSLHEKFGEEIAVLAVGTAGEEGMLSATVSASDLEGRPSRHAARGGLGAVMGRKNLKAIVVDQPTWKLREAADKENFKRICSDFAKSLHQNSEPLRNYGNLLLVEYINALGALPIENYRVSESERAASLSGETLAKTIRERGGKMGHRCSRGCVIGCSNVVLDSGGRYVTSGFEYESAVMLGTNLGLFDFDSVVGMERFCDDFGIDTIEVGAALAVAAEAGLARFGDAGTFMSLLDEIKRLTTTGRVLAAGAAVTGKVFGVQRVPVVKGQSLAAYDPRGIKGTGATYATSPMGADHTAGNLLPGMGSVDVRERDGQAADSARVQELVAAVDMCGCIYAGISQEILDTYAALLTAYHGKPFSGEALRDLGRQTLMTEHRFNLDAGWSPTANDVPYFFREEPDSRGEYFDVDPEELAAVFDKRPVSS